MRNSYTFMTGVVFRHFRIIFMSIILQYCFNFGNFLINSLSFYMSSHWLQCLRHRYIMFLIIWTILRTKIPIYMHHCSHTAKHWHNNWEHAWVLIYIDDNDRILSHTCLNIISIMHIFHINVLPCIYDTTYNSFSKVPSFRKNIEKKKDS